MIKHDFHVEGGYPQFGIEDEYYMLNDLYNRDVKQVEPIVQNLQLIISGKLDNYDIDGYDTTIVECSKDGCIIYYDVEDTKKGPLPVSWFLDLYKDWLQFLRNFYATKER